MRFDAGNILGIKITRNSRLQILEYIEKYLSKNFMFQRSSVKKSTNPLIVVTPNPEQIVYAQGDKHFADIVNRADIAIPDGIGVVWASRLLHANSVKATLPGIELMEELVSIASKRHVLTLLIGGREKVALEAFECLQKKHKKLRGEGQNGPKLNIANGALFVDNDQKITEKYFSDLAQRIVATETQIVFVGLGAPKQEYFIEKLQKKLMDQKYNMPIVLMAVGGSFDELSGRVPKAPALVLRVGLKWLWRLMLEPWRIRRQLALIVFVWLVLRERLFQRPQQS